MHALKMKLTSGFTAQDMTIKERIEYYEQELNCLISPKNFREQVLNNVYRCLLQSCLEIDFDESL